MDRARLEHQRAGAVPRDRRRAARRLADRAQGAVVRQRGSVVTARSDNRAEVDTPDTLARGDRSRGRVVAATGTPA